jgi:hypothetical protein
MMRRELFCCSLENKGFRQFAARNAGALYSLHRNARQRAAIFIASAGNARRDGFSGTQPMAP